jgi:chromosome segregation ATPase
MSEQQQELRARLEELDAELKRTQASDDTQRQHLRAMQRDVQALLDRSDETDQASDPPAVHGLRAGLEHFEATHAVLATLVEQVLNTLSNAGI